MKKLITFEVDTDAYWDMVAKVGDGGHAIGSRLAEVFLAPKCVAITTRLGMAVYGVTVASVTDAPADAPVATEAAE